MGILVDSRIGIWMTGQGDRINITDVCGKVEYREQLFRVLCIKELQHLTRKNAERM